MYKFSLISAEKYRLRAITLTYRKRSRTLVVTASLIPSPQLDSYSPFVPVMSNDVIRLLRILSTLELDLAH